MFGPVREVLDEVEYVGVVGIEEDGAVEAALFQGFEVVLEKQ